MVLPNHDFVNRVVASEIKLLRTDCSIQTSPGTVMDVVNEIESPYYDWGMEFHSILNHMFAQFRDEKTINHATRKRYIISLEHDIGFALPCSAALYLATSSLIYSQIIMLFRHCRKYEKAKKYPWILNRLVTSNLLATALDRIIEFGASRKVGNTTPKVT